MQLVNRGLWSPHRTIQQLEGISPMISILLMEFCFVYVIDVLKAVVVVFAFPHHSRHCCLHHPVRFPMSLHFDKPNPWNLLYFLVW
ncbi:Uncharacterised protein [Chlamydia trachomatis]|nr:Uncharacterised protein [Chlamydia trachomatis]